MLISKTGKRKLSLPNKTISIHFINCLLNKFLNYNNL